MKVKVISEGLDGGDDLRSVPVVHVVVKQHERDIRDVSFPSLNTNLLQLKRRLPLGKPHSRGSSHGSPRLTKLLEEDLGQHLVTLALKPNNENDSQPFFSRDEVDSFGAITVVNGDRLLAGLALDGFEAFGEGGAEEMTFDHGEQHRDFVFGRRGGRGGG